VIKHYPIAHCSRRPQQVRYDSAEGDRRFAAQALVGPEFIQIYIKVAADVHYRHEPVVAIVSVHRDGVELPNIRFHDPRHSCASFERMLRHCQSVYADQLAPSVVLRISQPVWEVL